MLGGYFTMLGDGATGTTARHNIGRLNTDGSLDASFDPGADYKVNTLAVPPDGKILVAGNFTKLGGGETSTTTRYGIGRLYANGAVDGSFDLGADNAVADLAVQADGNILVAGFFTMLGGGGTGTSARSRIGRVNAGGVLDASFDPGASNFVNSVTVQPDAKIVVGGGFTATAAVGPVPRRATISGGSLLTACSTPASIRGRTATSSR